MKGIVNWGWCKEQQLRGMLDVNKHQSHHIPEQLNKRCNEGRWITTSYLSKPYSGWRCVEHNLVRIEIFKKTYNMFLPSELYLYVLTYKHVRLIALCCSLPSFNLSLFHSKTHCYLFLYLTHVVLVYPDPLNHTPTLS